MRSGLLERFPVGFHQEFNHLIGAEHHIIVVPPGEELPVIDDLHHLILHHAMADLFQGGLVLPVQHHRIVPHEGTAGGFHHLMQALAAILRQHRILDHHGDFYLDGLGGGELGEGRRQRAEGRNQEKERRKKEQVFAGQ